MFSGHKVLLAVGMIFTRYRMCGCYVVASGTLMHDLYQTQWRSQHVDIGFT
jgi:hypothetical protein